MKASLAVVASLCASAILYLPGESPPPGGGDHIVTLCRLYLDPHDQFTRVVPPQRAANLRSSATLSTIDVNYTGFTPEAQIAFRTAIDIWLTQLSSSVPIVVDARFTNLGTTGLLGEAGFLGASYNFAGAPTANVFFPGPIANRLTGVDQNGATPEIVVSLNSAAPWNYATNGVPVSGKVDFVSVVLHELAHGLGFAGTGSVFNGLGTVGYLGLPFVYDLAVVDSANTSLLNQSVYPAGTAVLANVIRGTGVSGPGLFWAGPKGIAANGGARPRLFAPATYLQGSSFQHLDDATYPAGTLNSLMTPSLGFAEVIHTPGGIVNGMLADMGWVDPGQTQPCSYGLSRSVAEVGTAGGTVLTTLSTTAGCPWSVTVTVPESSSFASITSAASGSGSTVVRVSVLPNTGNAPRLAVVQIADQTLLIAQASTVPCSYTLDPGTASIAGAGGSGTVNIQTLPECPWTASSTPAEALITSANSGVGPATVAYTVAMSTSHSPRDVTLAIAGKPFVITQGPAPPAMTLDRTSLQFAAIESAGSFSTVTSPQTVRLTQSGTGSVSWTAVSSSPWLAVSPASGTGSVLLTISTQYAAAIAATQTGTVTLTFTGASNASSAIAVTLSSLTLPQSAAPFGSFDTPLDGASGLVGSIPVTGWALDDVEVARVRIMRDPVPGEPQGSLVYIGDADLVDGARPDVQAQFASLPRSTRGGWGYLMLTNFLPNLGNGTFRLTAIADDNDGHSTVLGSKTIVCANAGSKLPFGAIDTPAQGGTATGDLINFGWVLSPAPGRADPPGGGTVQIVIDGSFISAVPSGWASRPDLSALFPAALFPGIASALGVAAIDTRTLSNGIHTIAWVVTDNQGNASGIGSRYFTVSNDSGVSLAARAASPARSPRDLLWRTGFDRTTPFQRARPDEHGRLTVRTQEIDRVELKLDRGTSGTMRAAAGNLPLPPGSHLDAATGTFTWQPGVGFVGAYDFVFGTRNVRIVVEPKRSLH